MTTSPPPRARIGDAGDGAPRCVGELGGTPRGVAFLGFAPAILTRGTGRSTPKSLVFERQSKIVCTIGPASDSLEALERLINAGMDVARLNFSHGSHTEHARRLATAARSGHQLQKAGRRPARPLRPQDPHAARSRAAPTCSPPDGEVTLVEVASKAIIAEEETIPIQLRGARRRRAAGRRHSHRRRAGGAARSSASSRGACAATSCNRAPCATRRAFTCRPAACASPTLTEKDKADLSFGLSLGVDYVALSFVRKSDDIRLVREICEAWGRPTPIVAKIETPAAVDDLEGIIASADAIMVARGDLGVEFPPERVPVIQKQILGLSRIYQRPVIVATEMLQSMVHATRPTRAEASDVANAVFDGTDAVMLSAESATGDHPDLAASMMARIIARSRGEPVLRAP